MSLSANRAAAWTIAIFALSLVPHGARAACPSNKPFASGILGTVKQGYSIVTVDASEVTPLGDELGQFWQSSDATASNNFNGVCPASMWWKLENSGNYALYGDLNGGSGCAPVGCASGALTTVVEDYGSPAPGINGTAYFIAWKVNETPALLRQYDYARTASESTVFDFVEFPTVHVTSCANSGLNVDFTYNLSDVAPNFHGATGPCSGSTPSTCTNNPTSAEEVIASYDIFVYTGAVEPGRDRSLWTQIQSVPYPGTGIPGIFESVAKHLFLPTFLSVGMSFKDDNGMLVPSKLVGRAVKVHCPPVLAEPQPNPEPDAIPKPKKKAVAVHRTAGG